MNSMTQIRLTPDGLWHRRRGIGRAHVTACGEPIAGPYESRDHELDDKLCPVCFTSHERDTGEMVKLEKRALEHADVDAFGEDEDQKTPVEPIFDGNKTTKGSA